MNRKVKIAYVAAATLVLIVVNVGWLFVLWLAATCAAYAYWEAVGKISVSSFPYAAFAQSLATVGFAWGAVVLTAWTIGFVAWFVRRRTPRARRPC